MADRIMARVPDSYQGCTLSLEMTLPTSPSLAPSMTLRMSGPGALDRRLPSSLAVPSFRLGQWRRSLEEFTTL